MGGYFAQFVLVQGDGQLAPGLHAALARRHHRIDAQQRHAAQNKRGYAGWQIHALSQAASGDRPAIRNLRDDIGQHGAAGNINRASPAGFAQRARFAVKFGAVNHCGGAQAAQKVGLLGPAGDGGNLIAQARQQRHRDGADPAAGTSHQHLAVVRGQPGIFERHHRQHCGVAGGADRHRLGQGQPFGQRHQPIALDPCHPGKSAMVAFTHPPAVQNNPVAGLVVGRCGGHDLAGKINSWHQRKLADDRRLGAQGQGVLVVDGGMGNANRHVAVHQVGLGQLGERRCLLFAGFRDKPRVEFIVHCLGSPTNSAGVGYTIGKTLVHRRIWVDRARQCRDR